MFLHKTADTIKKIELNSKHQGRANTLSRIQTQTHTHTHTCMHMHKAKVLGFEPMKQFTTHDDSGPGALQQSIRCV